MFPQTTSNGASIQEQSIPGQNHIQVLVPENNNQIPKSALDWTFDWSFTDSLQDHQADGDHKLHHFHFERFSKSRRKMLLSILFKVLLIICYLSCLLYGSSHLLY